MKWNLNQVRDSSRSVSQSVIRQSVSNGNGNGIYIPHFLYVYISNAVYVCKGKIGHQHI